MSDSDMVLLPPEFAAFSGNKNCSNSLRLRDAVNDAALPVWLLFCDRRELAVIDMAEELLSLRARCLSTPVVVHWNRSELSDALSLEESGLGEAGAMQLAALAGRVPPRKLLLLPPPPPLLCVDPPPAKVDEPMACKLLDADETRRGMIVTAEWMVAEPVLQITNQIRIHFVLTLFNCLQHIISSFQFVFHSLFVCFFVYGNCLLPISGFTSTRSDRNNDDAITGGVVLKKR